MGKTSIEWCEHSINPLRVRLNGSTGHYCEKVSAGCKNCYSSRLQPRFGMPQFQEQRRADVEHFLDPSKLLQVLRRKKPTKYFWCDMTDMFGDWVPFESIAACFGVMAATPQHTHQVLTKRPARALEFFRWLGNEEAGKLHVGLCDAMQAPFDWDPDYRHCEELLANACEWPLPNVWLGVSAENQEQADKRIPLLLECPAAVRWVSAEPLLGPISFERMWTVGDVIVTPESQHPTPTLDWVVVGGESGHGARECKLEWLESLERQCRHARVAFFCKQLGAKPIGVALDMPVPYEAPYPIKHSKGGDIVEFPEHLRVRQFPEVRA